MRYLLYYWSVSYSLHSFFERIKRDRSSEVKIVLSIMASDVKQKQEKMSDHMILRCHRSTLGILHDPVCLLFELHLNWGKRWVLCTIARCLSLAVRNNITLIQAAKKLHMECRFSFFFIVVMCEMPRKIDVQIVYPYGKTTNDMGCRALEKIGKDQDMGV